MELIPYHPFRDLEKFFDKWVSDLHALELADFPAIGQPKMDIYETKDKVKAEIEMPGIDPKTIDVSVEDNILRVEGKKEEKVEEKKKGYYKKEIKSGYLRRIASLPAEAQGEKAKAEYDNGMLKIEIPKAKKAAKKAKKVKVKIKK